MRWTSSGILRALALAVLLSGCSDGEPGETDHDGNSDESSKGKSTEAMCPSGDAPTYDNFGKSFMGKYCVRCHSSTLKDAARNGAPAGHDFDRLDGILPVAEHIDQYAAIGPAAMNQLMPPTDPKPTDDERRRLGEWLACEANP